jgi:hypothetical protein
VYGTNHFNYHNWQSTINGKFVNLALRYELSGTVGFIVVLHYVQERQKWLKLPNPPLPRDISNQFLVAFQEFVAIMSFIRVGMKVLAAPDNQGHVAAASLAIGNQVTSFFYQEHRDTVVSRVSNVLLMMELNPSTRPSTLAITDEYYWLSKGNNLPKMISTNFSGPTFYKAVSPV